MQKRWDCLPRAPALSEGCLSLVPVSYLFDSHPQLKPLATRSFQVLTLPFSFVYTFLVRAVPVPQSNFLQVYCFMLSCVVNSRPHPRRFSPFLSGRPTLPILEASPLALSHSLDALCSKSVHQPFSNQSLPHSFLKMPGCMGLLPLDKHFNVQTFGRADVQTIPRSISFLFKFLRTLLRSAKTQLFSF
jgi:hypothetical protein